MKYLLFAAALSLCVAGGAAAQTSAPSSNPNAHSQPSSSPNEGRSMSNEGSVKPCGNNQASGTSDREGGNAKTAASANQTNNPGGSESSGGC